MHFLLECPPPRGEVGYVSFGAVLSVIEVNTIFSYLGLVVTNLSSEFQTKRESNQSPQLQRLARMLKFGLKQV